MTFSPPPPRKLNSTLSCNKAHGGFSLVELSIVLVIIGMLVSGVLVERDMIRAAELRSITSDKDRIQTAVNLFQDKYQGLPGDITNATDFWGAMTGGALCPNSTGGTGAETCNGNGNGTIGGWSAINWENLLFWQHLSNAGLIEGQYSGVSGTINQEMTSKIKSAFWRNEHVGSIGQGNGTWFEGDYGHSLNLYGIPNNNPILPTELWNIDKKIDDGLPGLGALVSREDNSPNCNNFNSALPASTATYNLTYNSNSCRPYFKNMW